jgi:hypothetical protein
MRLKKMDEKLKTSLANDETTFRLFKEPILKMQETLSSQQVAVQSLEERKEKELKMLDTNINLDV